MLGLSSCSGENKNDVEIISNDDDGWNIPAVTEEHEVIKKTMKTVYISNTEDLETDVSYWYVTWSRAGNIVRGYDVLKLDVPYFCLHSIHKLLRASDDLRGIKKDEYLQITILYKEYYFIIRKVA